MINQKENECLFRFCTVKRLLYLCVCTHVCKSLRKSEECAGSLGAGVTGDSELPPMAAGD